MASLGLICSRDAPQTAENIFRFMDLPTEIRLKIYSYLLPGRTHTIVTQYPYNGYFYNTSIVPLHSAQSFYPFGRTAPRDQLTTYKVLNTNFRTDFPAPGIYPQIFRVCRRMHDEAEPVLYGGNTVFDFGVHTNALQAFFQDRSVLARRSVRTIRIAKEIPEEPAGNSDEPRGILNPAVDNSWTLLCKYLINSLPDLRVVDLTVWSPTGNLASLSHSSATPEHLEEEQEREWREWEWIRDLLDLEVLKSLKITYWGFNSRVEGGVGFYDWHVKKMLNNPSVKEQMIKDGVVFQGFVVLRGGATV